MPPPVRMLARVAEAFYWTARNLERADTISRLLEVSHAMALEGAGAGLDPERSVWRPSVEVTGDGERFLMNHLRADERSVVWFLTLSTVNVNSIRSSVMRARDNARGVRDRLPPEVWEAVNALSLAVASWTPTRLAREGVYGFCQLIRRDSHLVQGLVDHGMRHDECWQFLRLGRFLERAEKTARLLEIKFHLAVPGDPAVQAAADLSQWRALLRSAGAYEAYLHVGNADLDPQAIARFLVLDEWFPRSIAYAFAEVEMSLEALVRLGTLRADVRALDLAHAGRALVGGRGPLSWDASLRRMLDQVQERCNAIGSAIALDAFAEAHEDIEGGRHAQASRQTQD